LRRDELRAEAAKVCRALRLGALAAPNGKEPAASVTGASGRPSAFDLDARVDGQAVGGPRFGRPSLS